MSVDLLDPDLQRTGTLWSTFEELRREGPVVRCPGRRGPGYWAVLGHAEICAAARDPAFSSWWGTRPEVVRGRDAARPLHNLDAPEHGALRAIAGPLLASADAFEPMLEGLVAETIGGFARQGGGDVVRLVAEPIASRWFAMWTGLGLGAAGELLARVSHVHEAGALLLDTARTDASFPRHAEDARHATVALGELLAQGAPSRSLLGAIAAAPLGPMEARLLAALFVEAGLPTLVDAIAFAVVELARNPALAREDIPLLVAELLRLGSPILQFARRARTTTVLGGRTIEEGEQIVLWFAAANRDPAVFEAPADLDPRRRPNPHLAFGVGPHRCLGAAFATGLLGTVVRTWSTTVTRATSSAPIPRRSSYLRGYETALVTVDA